MGGVYVNTFRVHYVKRGEKNNFIVEKIDKHYPQPDDQSQHQQPTIVMLTVCLLDGAALWAW
jgi:hypothetical protein